MANGVNVTVNADGSLRLSGTATAVEVATWAQDMGALAGKTLILSQSGVPDGYSFYIVERTSAGVPTVRAAGVPFQLAESTATVELSLRRTDLSKAADASRVLVQLEEGESATAWQRPDVIDWGGVASPVNLWRPVADGDAGGLTVKTNPDGSVHVTGSSQAGRYSSVSSVKVTISEAGIAVGDALTMSSVGYDGINSGVSANVKFFGADGKQVGANLGINSSNFIVPDGAETVVMNVIESGKAVENVDVTLYPMLEKGAAANLYVPYPMGGGIPLTNLWADVEQADTSSYGVSFSRRDDGGIAVSGSAEAGKTPYRQSLKFTPEESRLEPGETYSLACGGLPGNMKCQVIIQKPDGAYLVYIPGDTFTMPGQFIEWHSNITVDDGTSVPDGTAIHPMLTRSDAPVSHFVPFTAGGGSSDLADLLPEGEFGGVSFERTGAGAWHVSGTSAVPYPVAKATVEMDGAYAMSGSMTGIGGVIAQANVDGKNVQQTSSGTVVFEVDGPKQVNLAIQVTPSDGQPGISVDADVSLSLIRIGDAGGGSGNLALPIEGRRDYSGDSGNDSKRELTGFDIMKGITANNYFIPDKVHDFSASGWSLAYTVLASGYGIGLSFPSSPGSTVYFGADDNQNAMLKISWYAVDGTHLTYSDNSGAVEPESAAVGVIVVRNMSDEIDTQVSCRPWARRVL